MFRQRRKSEKGVVVDLKIDGRGHPQRESLEELLKEVWTLKEDHPDIQINIEMTR